VVVVVVFHLGRVLWPSAQNWLVPGGTIGVDIFFVLSGYLITTLLLDEHVRRGTLDLAAFARRRFWRLFPGLVGLFAIVLVVAALGPRMAVSDVVWSAVWALTFTANLAFMRGEAMIEFHLWSVAIEGQFYLIWGLVLAAALGFPRARVIVTAAALGGIVATTWWRTAELAGGTEPLIVYTSTFCRLDAPLIGAVAAVARSAGRLGWLRGRTAQVIAAMGVVILGVAAYVVDYEDRMFSLETTVVALASACVILGATAAGEGLLVRVLTFRPLVFVGVISYSLYLWHLPIFQWIDLPTTGSPGPVRAAMGIGAAVAAAIASYFLVERPLIRRFGARAAR
jgi:peptidoglycan/LPS O-acetylase OafA/YrhL